MGRVAADKTVVETILWPLKGADDEVVGSIRRGFEDCAAGNGGELWSGVEGPGNAAGDAVGDLRGGDGVNRGAVDGRPVVWPVTSAEGAGSIGGGFEDEDCAGGSGDNLWGGVECLGDAIATDVADGVGIGVWVGGGPITGGEDTDDDGDIIGGCVAEVPIFID